MKLIDRYIYAVTEHLPEDSREDVGSELRGNIEDMLPEHPTENDIRDVLLKLGNPKVLADGYSDRKRYLIGPGLYDNYFSVLKLVISIVSLVFIFLTFLDGAFTASMDGRFNLMSFGFFINLLVVSIQGVLEGVLQGFLWVTLVFVLIERSGVSEGKIPFVKKKWSPDDLTEVPVSKKRKISRIETVFSMFCSVFFIALLYFKADLIGLYTKESNGIILVSPLFVRERLQLYITIILLLAIIQLSIFIWKFISMKWTFPLAIANAVNNFALSVFVCVILSDNSLFNLELISKIADITKTSLTANISIWFSRSIWITLVIFIAISIFDSVMGFIKCKK